jgi:hypothetical protein
MKTINTMSGMFNHIQHMVSKGIIDLDDFYNVSYDRSVITLQGRYSSDKLSDYTEFLSFNINGCNGFVEGKADIDGVEVKIVFT